MAWATEVIERAKPIDEDVPYWSLLIVAMDLRVRDVKKDRRDESMDTIYVTDAEVAEGRLTLCLIADTFVGTWYPVRMELRLPPDDSVMWFGAPDLTVKERDQSKLVWPTDDGPWPAIYLFRLDTAS